MRVMETAYAPSVAGYLLLALAIAAEVVGTVALKLSDGFTRLTASVVTVVAFTAAVVLLALVVQRLPLGFSYAVWAGVGTAAVALIGILAFGESLSALKVVGLVLIVAGVVSLNLTAQ